MMRPKSSAATRTDDHDVGLSRAKIRSVKQTVAIIMTYVASSTPFIFAQLWVVWGSPGEAISKSTIEYRMAWLKNRVFLESTHWQISFGQRYRNRCYSKKFNKWLKQPLLGWPCWQLLVHLSIQLAIKIGARLSIKYLWAQMKRPRFLYSRLPTTWWQWHALKQPTSFQMGPKTTPVLNKSCTSATYRGWETNRGSLVAVEDELTNVPSRQGY